MKLWVGVTDDKWFHFLAAQQPDEANFWQPGGRGFRAIEPGAPFLFKLHSPNNFIAGGGFFVRYVPLPLSLAWEAFGTKNGMPSLETFRARIRRYRKDPVPLPDPEIGCIVLSEPFFFPRNQWIPVPKDWQPNIVRGKSYDMATGTGAALWDDVQQRLDASAFSPGVQLPLVAEARYGPEYLSRPRLGQGGFRALVTDAYQRRCAVTGERTLPTLQAAHIQPYAVGGPHDTANGLLLRADLHILFDRGYMTLSDDLRVEVSQRIRDDFGNGRDYYRLHGSPVSVTPKHHTDRPGVEFLRWHQDHVYLA